MVERDASVLDGRRIAAFVALFAGVVVWFLVAPHVGAVGLWPSVIVVSFGVLPATLGLVYIALPLSTRDWRFHLTSALVLALIALVASEAGSNLVANFAKLFAAVFAGWAFLQFFEALSWVVIVALIVPVVDAISVFAPQGPTHVIVTNPKNFHIYTDVSVAFPAPGRGAANLGPPDILFYALFLAAALRWRLRPGWTWVATTGMYALTIVITSAVTTAGLPALPFLSFGFLLANVDLLWARFRPRRAS